jgi:hypothetical protein
VKARGTFSGSGSGGGSVGACKGRGERAGLRFIHFGAGAHRELVAAGDVVEQLLNDGTSDVNDFDWIAQLRYYWEENPLVGNAARVRWPRPVQRGGLFHRWRLTPSCRQRDVMVKMITTNVTYGYEYLGNSGRLVITPLTDRRVTCAQATAGCRGAGQAPPAAVLVECGLNWMV